MDKFTPTHTVYINGIKKNIMFSKDGFFADHPEHKNIPCSFHRIKESQFIPGCMLYTSGNTYQLLSKKE